MTIIYFLLILAVVFAVLTVSSSIPDLLATRHRAMKLTGVPLACATADRTFIYYFGIHVPAMKYAISSVESGGVKDLVGAAGEQTIYQFKPERWSEFSRAPMRQASDQEIDRVADASIRQTQDFLIERRRVMSPFTIAVLHREGIHAEPPFSDEVVDYADRVSSLYYDRLDRAR